MVNPVENYWSTMRQFPIPKGVKDHQLVRAADVWEAQICGREVPFLKDQRIFDDHNSSNK